MFHSKKPFKDRSFYLDLRYYRKQDELIKAVKKLGGKLESFLSKEVSHVITDREFPKSGNGFCTPLTPKSLASNSTFSHTNSPLDYSVCHASPSACESSPFLSRGQSLVQKAKQKQSGTSDIFDICTLWNIRVIHIEKVLAFISKCKILSLKKCAENKAPQKKAPPTAEAKFYKRQLLGHFIKVEDVKSRYSTSHKVFKNLKESFDSDFLRAVARMCGDKTFKKSSSALPQKHQTSGLVANRKLSFSSTKNDPELVPKTPFFRPLSTSNKINCVSNGISQDRKKPLQIATVKKENTKLDRDKKTSVKRRYCEICRCSYFELERHLVTEKHQNFLQNTLNFNQVRLILTSLPSVPEFLLRDELEAEKDFEMNSFESTKQGSEKSSECLPFCNEAIQPNQKTDNTSSATEIVSDSYSLDSSSDQFPHLSEPAERLVTTPQDNPPEPSLPLKTNQNEGPMNGLEIQKLGSRRFFGDSTFVPSLEMDYCVPQLSQQGQLAINFFHRNFDFGFVRKDCQVEDEKLQLAEQEAALDNGKCSDVSEDLQKESFLNETKTFETTTTAIQESNSVLRTFPFTNFGFGWNNSVPSMDNGDVEGTEVMYEFSQPSQDENVTTVVENCNINVDQGGDYLNLEFGRCDEVSLDENLNTRQSSGDCIVNLINGEEIVLDLRINK